MTVDDEKSVYVGGLPYDCTQEDLRRAFDLYGAIVDVKIINDRQVGGKCYGFVTFRNPRSAVDAIMDMNGRKIGGRVVRVNEVHTRGGRPNFNRENFHRDAERDDDWERIRERERDHIRDRDRYLDRNIEHSQDHNREADFERGRDFDRARGHPIDQHGDREDDDHERRGDHDREWEEEHDMDWDHDRDLDKLKDRDAGKETVKEQQPRLKNSDHQSRDLSSNSSDEYRSQVKEQLELSMERREELQKELTIIGDKVEEKQLLISDLQKKSQKLEDALAASKKLTSQRLSMLKKLHSSFRRSQELAERLKISEQELQSIVDVAISDLDMGEDASARDGSVYANGMTNPGDLGQFCSPPSRVVFL